MIGGIYTGYSAAQLYGTSNYLAQKSYSVSNYDYKAAQNELLAKYKGNQNSLQTLKTDSANFLDQYTASMQQMGKAADAVRGGNFDKLLYGNTQDTSATPSAANVERTAKAIEDMATQFNSSLKLLNNNADRGSGVEKQILRMVQSPTSERSMELIGISTKNDGTFEVNSSKLRDALTQQPSVVRSVVADSFGMANGIARDSSNGLSQSPVSLISNDLASMKQQQLSTGFMSMSTYTKSGAYNAMNLNAVGVLMNMLV